jgi:hypothetical protein
MIVDENFVKSTIIVVDRLDSFLIELLVELCASFCVIIKLYNS